MHLEDNNFSLGFGQKSTKLKPGEDEYKLFEYLDSFLNIAICLDVQKYYRFYHKEFMNNNISFFLGEIKERIIEKREIYNKLKIQDYEEKEFFMIQSDSTNINDILYFFPNKKYLIHVDTKKAGIFKINYSEELIKRINEIKALKAKVLSGLNLKTKNLIEENSLDKNTQETEYERMKNIISEKYNDDINEIISENFYNIIERKNPIKSKFFELKKKYMVSVFALDN